MAGFDYISAQKTSDRLIKQFGFQLPILKAVSSFDPVLGKNTITSIQISTVSFTYLQRNFHLTLKPGIW
jgi:hypothetical protein